MSMIKMDFEQIDTLFIHGKIYTVDLTIDEIREGKREFPIYEDGFLAVKDNKIVAMGETEYESLIGEKTKVIDLQGKTMIPGMLDSHFHIAEGGDRLMWVSLREAKSAEECGEILAEKAKELPKGKWLIAFEWNDAFWAEDDKLDRYVLDRYVNDRPVFVDHIVGHSCAVNTKALEIAGFTKDTRDPEIGLIERDENGVPNGRLHELNNTIKALIPAHTEEEIMDIIEYAGKYLNRNGITGGIDNILPLIQARAYGRLYQEGRLTFRSYITWGVRPGKDSDAVKENIKELENMPISTKFGNDMLRYNGIKVQVDGVPSMGTAYMRKHYPFMPNENGILHISEENLMKIGEVAGRNHWQLTTHTCGDKAMDMAIKAMVHANETAGNTDNRHFLVHGNFPWPDQIDVMKKNNIGIATQPGIYHLMGEEQILGEELTSKNMPCKSCLDAGIVVAGGTDFAVIPVNPFPGMYAAITREAADGKVYGEKEKVTPTEALIMWTMNSAYLMFAEDKIGSLKVGKLADLVILDRDILEVEPKQLKETKVLLTMVDGKIVYQE